MDQVDDTTQLLNSNIKLAVLLLAVLSGKGKAFFQPECARNEFLHPWRLPLARHLLLSLLHTEGQIRCVQVTALFPGGVYTALPTLHYPYADKGEDR